MAIDSIISNAATQITGAIRQAARSTGISFEYLLTTARIESSLNPSAQASTSSAKGLYQFIEQTWLGTLKGTGAANGYGQYADAISRSADGRYDVADPGMRAAIMRLRSDPQASATMAGSFTRANADQLAGAIGRQPSEGELYIAHFLGPAGAGKLINAATNQPGASAADMFPQAAAANRSIFYEAAGRPRAASDVYGKLTGRFETARATSFTPGSSTAAVATTSTAAVATTPDPAGVTQALALAHDSLPPLADTKPLFQAMFTDRARAAVTQTVSSLWAPSSAATPGNAAGTISSAPPGAAQALDLFTDSQTNVRKLFGSTG